MRSNGVWSQTCTCVEGWGCEPYVIIVHTAKGDKITSGCDQIECIVCEGWQRSFGNDILEEYESIEISFVQNTLPPESASSVLHHERFVPITDAQAWQNADSFFTEAVDKELVDFVESVIARDPSSELVPVPFSINGQKAVITLPMTILGSSMMYHTHTLRLWNGDADCLHSPQPYNAPRDDRPKLCRQLNKCVVLSIDIHGVLSAHCFEIDAALFFLP